TTSLNPTNRAIGPHYAAYHLGLQTLHAPGKETVGVFAVLGMDRLNPSLGLVIGFLPGFSEKFIESGAEIDDLHRLRYCDKQDRVDVVGQLPELLFAGAQGSFSFLAQSNVAGDSQDGPLAIQQENAGA